MKTIILASNNNHKIKEFKEIFDGFEIKSLKDIGFSDDIVEDGSTFEENSKIKAYAIKEFLGKQSKNVLIMADDSGLCVDSLNGEPGVYSARYAGNHNDADNRKLLLENLKDKEDRFAHFVCSICCLNGDECVMARGETDGRIIEEELGDKSFGYDCLFYSTDLNKTFGEASAEEKNSVSHRKRAIEDLKIKLGL